MPSPVRIKKTATRVRQGQFPFVVRVAVPDGGFGCALYGVNAWHRYSNNTQRRGLPQCLGEQKLWTWCFETLEIAKSFRHRFGGQIVPLTIQRVPSRQSRSRLADPRRGDIQMREAETEVLNEANVVKQI